MNSLIFITFIFSCALGGVVGVGMWELLGKFFPSDVYNPKIQWQSYISYLSGYIAGASFFSFVGWPA